MSLPSRERGLKYHRIADHFLGPQVAPFAGAWIEIPVPLSLSPPIMVAPFAGAWIEITVLSTSIQYLVSLPSRERGLKLNGVDVGTVAAQGRSLRGSVD